ncbi:PLASMODESMATA CALLOSE-BINDING PROTEIN 1-like isoform X2 [Apium graveolens]|uniref:PLASMODESMATA CALLOSE-BINDING PROTEIN 1-like isoform X1 n=1 Tax=Apium graveolens TaxID=4045 RepID=UPI003D7BBB81
MYSAVTVELIQDVYIFFVNMLPVAMNIYYQNSGKSPSDCDFVQTAVLSSSNPSYTGCNYPGGTEAKMIMNITDGLQNKKVLSSVSTSLVLAATIGVAKAKV